MQKSWTIRAFLATSLGVLLAALISWTAAADEASDFKATARPLSAPDIAKLVIGNTFNGKPGNGNEWFEFYDPNGTVRGTAAHDGKYSGQWWLDGDSFCTRFPAYNWQHCSTIWVNQTANKVLFWDSDGSADNSLNNVMTGNPQGL